MSAFQSTFDSLRGFPRRLSDAAREVRRTASLAGAAMLAALSLVLNQFTIAVSQFLEIGFSFLAAGTCAFLYGPWLAGLMGIVTDVAGYFLRPNGGFFSRLHAQRVPAGLFIRLLAVQKTRVPVAHVLRLPVRGARHQPGAHAAVAEYHVRQRFRDFRHAAYQKCR